jgi:hypothetical protein
MEEMLETVVCAPRRTEPSGSEGISDSEEYSLDEDQGEYRRSPRGRRTADEDLKTSLQIMDLQTLEMDSASSPYSYAFRIDAFNRKVSAVDGEFQNLGQGKYLRQGPVQITATDASPLDPYLADHLVEVYFRDLWPLFPIVDKDAVYNQLQDTNPQLPNGLLTAIYFAAASTISQRSSNSGARSAISTPSLSPRTSLPFPPALVETLRSTLATAVSNLSSPTLEPRITSIQTITLLCLYDRTLSSEQRLVLISDLVRMGQYILLHRSITNISTRDKSLRKHLWWTIFLLEVWTSACDRSPSTIDLAEVDIQLPIEAEEIGHQAYTALVALTRILLDTLRKVYSPTVKSEDVSTEVIRLRGWVNDWYNNLPRELLVSESSTDADTAEFLLSGCHAVLLLLYHPFRNEEVVRTEINRSQGIITDAIGRLGGNIGKFGIIAKLIGELARTVGT